MGAFVQASRRFRRLQGLHLGLAVMSLGVLLHSPVALPDVAGPLKVALPMEDLTLAPMLERVIPGVVNIATQSQVAVERHPFFNDPFFRRFFELPPQQRNRIEQNLGSGVIVDAQRGLVLTSNHVIEAANAIEVTLQDGRSFAAKVIGSDPETDVAVIQIPAKELIGVPLGNSDVLRVGDFVVAIGSPFGLSQTVTSGIVSALGRTSLGIGGYEDFIQTDASINPGNSGGALVNLKGELVGINTAILGPNGGNIGIGFAIPVNMAHGIMEQLVEYGEVRRGQLGVVMQDLTPELARAFGIEGRSGAVITQVLRDTSAASAGLRPGDLIIAVNGHEVQSAAGLRNQIGLLRVGDTAALDIMRDGQPYTIKVRLQPPAMQPDPRQPPITRP